MKHNIFGYLFVIFVIGIMSFSIYRVKIKNKNEENNIVIANEENINKIDEITLAIAGIDSINPIISNNKQVQNITKLIYEPLINITDDYKLEACLAKEWSTSDGLSYVIKLREGIKWSDGSRCTSTDVKYTIDKLKDENASSVYDSNVHKIQEVDIIDNVTLRIILSEKIPKFEYYLSFPIMCSSYYGEDNFWNTEKNNKPVSTGRYKIKEITGSTIILEKNNDWWKKKNEDTYINKINVNIYTSLAEMYNAFKLGNIDLIVTENTSYQDYIGTIGYNTTEIEGREFIFMALNNQNQLLADASIRKAVRNAINKDEVVANIKGYSTSNFILNTNNYLINREDENYYNLGEVSNILNSQNWLIRNGVWQRSINYSIQKLEFNLVVKVSDSTRVEIAKNIKEQLANQGIIINLIGASDEDYNNYLANKNYDMILCSSYLPIAPDLNTYFGENNIANYNNDEVKSILNDINNITDENELKNKYQRLYEIYNGEAPYIGIARKKAYVLTNTDLVGEVKSNWFNPFYGIKDWYKK